MAAVPPRAPKSRLPLYLGVSVAAVGGYYLYQSRGNVKVAQKQIEHDAYRAKAKIQGEGSDRAKEVKKEGEKLGAQAGAKYDEAVSSGKARIDQGEKKLEELRAQTNAKIAEADQKIEKSIQDGKKKASSWWGGSK